MSTTLTMRTTTDGNAQSPSPWGIHRWPVSRALRSELKKACRVAGCRSFDADAPDPSSKCCNAGDGAATFYRIGAQSRKLACDAAQLRSLASPQEPQSSTRSETRPGCRLNGSGDTRPSQSLLSWGERQLGWLAGNPGSLDSIDRVGKILERVGKVDWSEQAWHRASRPQPACLR